MALLTSSCQRSLWTTSEYYSGYKNYFSFLFACRILLIKTGRRWPYIICIFISGTAFLLMLPFERGVYPSDWPIVVMAMIGNLFVSTTFAMIWMYTPELFPTNIRWNYDILLPKLFWTTVRKKIIVIEKNFWNSRLKAKNLQKFWDYWNNLF